MNNVDKAEDRQDHRPRKRRRKRNISTTSSAGPSLTAIQQRLANAAEIRHSAENDMGMGLLKLQLEWSYWLIMIICRPLLSNTWEMEQWRNQILAVGRQQYHTWSMLQAWLDQILARHNELLQQQQQQQLRQQRQQRSQVLETRVTVIG